MENDQCDLQQNLLGIKQTEQVCIAKTDVGYGVFAGQDFLAGEVIFTINGPLLTKQKVIAKGETQGNPIQIGPDMYIDVVAPAVYLNHSCTPNAGLLGDVHLIALHDIRQGEEIRFDYSTCMSEQCWTMECQCKARTCRGIISDFHELPLTLQLQYLDKRIVQTFIVREWINRQRNTYRDIASAVRI